MRFAYGPRYLPNREQYEIDRILDIINDSIINCLTNTVMVPTIELPLWDKYSSVIINKYKDAGWFNVYIIGNIHPKLILK